MAKRKPISEIRHDVLMGLQDLGWHIKGFKNPVATSPHSGSIGWDESYISFRIYGRKLHIKASKTKDGWGKTITDDARSFFEECKTRKEMAEKLEKAQSSLY